VVCTDVGDCKRLVEDGRTGFVIPRSDTVSLISAVDKIVRGKFNTDKSGARGKVIKNYSIEVIAQKLLDIYSRVLSDIDKVGIKHQSQC
jgi:glycosyltransferase involved in cell wall biosynthesis